MFLDLGHFSDSGLEITGYFYLALVELVVMIYPRIGGRGGGKNCTLIIREYPDETLHGVCSTSVY